MTFTERVIEVDGARLRCRQAGQGPPLVHLPGGAAPLTPAHAQLARRFRVLVLEAAGAALAAADRARAVTRALDTLGIDACGLLATAEDAPVALALAAEAPARVRALVLEAPAGDLGRGWADLAVPTLVLRGTRAPRGPDGDPAALAAGAHLVLVYDAGTTIAADRPEAFVEVVADFLERREAFVISRTDTLIHP